jgi:pyruvate dehydrogenase E1 component
VPNCITYDPTFAYEVAVIVQDGLRRMVTEQEDVFYYLTVMNENYEHPAMPEGAAPGILKGMYQFAKGAASNGPRVQLLGSGTIFMEAIAAAALLKKDWGVEPTSGPAPASTNSRAKARTVRAGTCCIRPGSRAFRTSAHASPKRAGR